MCFLSCQIILGISWLTTHHHDHPTTIPFRYISIVNLFGPREFDLKSRSAAVSTLSERRAAVRARSCCARAVHLPTTLRLWFNKWGQSCGFNHTPLHITSFCVEGRNCSLDSPYNVFNRCMARCGRQACAFPFVCVSLLLPTLVKAGRWTESSLICAGVSSCAAASMSGYPEFAIPRTL